MENSNLRFLSPGSWLGTPGWLVAAESGILFWYWIDEVGKPVHIHRFVIRLDAMPMDLGFIETDNWALWLGMNVCGFVVFATIYFCLFHVLHHTWTRFRFIHVNDRHDIVRWMITAIQNFITFPLACHALWSSLQSSHPLLAMPLSASRSGQLSVILVIAHSCFDGAWWLLTAHRLRMRPDWSLVLHHAGVCVLFPLLTLCDRGAALLWLLTLHEGSSPLIALRGTLLAAGIRRDGRTYTYTMLALLPTFVLCHAGVNAVDLFVCVRERALLLALPLPVLACVCVCVSLFTALSALWSVVLCVRTRTAWLRYRRTIATLATTHKQTELQAR